MRGARDWSLATALAVVPLAASFAILRYAEPVKSETAAGIARRIADANRSRRAHGRPAVTGAIDDSSPLVADGSLDPEDWDYLPYRFYGADDAASPCVLASALRRADGPRGTPDPAFRSWGVCVDREGRVQRFDGRCTLDCRAPAAPAALPAPVRPAPEEAPRPRVRAPAASAAPSPPAFVPVPGLPPLHFDGRRAGGCSATGCSGTSCCDPQTDACLSCPGAPCCEKGLGCNGVCYGDEDCLQGCRCVKLPDSPSGNCRGN